MSEDSSASVNKWRGEIQALLEKISNAENPDQPAIVTDCIVIYARRWFDVEGTAISSVCYLVPNQDQPTYVSIGLLNMSHDLMLDDFTSLED